MCLIRFITFLHKSSLIHTELTGLVLSRTSKQTSRKRRPDFIEMRFSNESQWNEMRVVFRCFYRQPNLKREYIFILLLKANIRKEKDGEKKSEWYGRETLVLSARNENLIHAFVLFIDTFYGLALQAPKIENNTTVSSIFGCLSFSIFFGVDFISNKYWMYRI